MLTQMREVLGGWNPRRGGGDALGTIRAGWLGLVGAEVARAAMPVAIANETLVIVTVSSSWSHQLAFLEPRIVRGVRELVPTAPIARLRFRVGTIRTPARGARPPGVVRPGRPAAPSQPAPQTASEALDRFRRSVQRARAAHAARGGGFCATCGVPIRRGARCVPCTEQARAEREVRCQRLLFDAPWLQPGEVLDMVPGLDAEAYDTIRRQLLRAWWDEMILARRRASLPRPLAPDRDRLRKIASSYVVLETKLDPHRLELDSPIRRNALGELYDFIRTIESA